MTPPGPDPFWKNETERVRAHRVREKHPNWSNQEIKQFIDEEDVKVREAFKAQQGLSGTKTSTTAISQIPLEELKDIHRVPTGYCSSLSDVDWINYYLKDDLLGGGSLYNIQVKMSEHFDKYLWAAADVWRGVGKTMLAFGKVTRKLCDHPELKLALICDDQARAKARLGVIKQIFQQNRLIIKDYGYLPHDKSYKGFKGKWSSYKIQLKRNIIAQEPSLTALSHRSSAMLGYHFDGTLIDDPWSEDLQAQKEAKVKWMNWFQGTYLGCIEAGAFCWMLFTRKGVDDLYDDLIYKQGMFTPFIAPAIKTYPSSYEYVYDKDGIPVRDMEPHLPFYPKGYGTPKVLIHSGDGEITDSCHGRFTMPYLLGKRKQAGAKKFNQEFQCKPEDEQGSLLDWNALKFYNDPSFKIEAREELVRDSASWVGFMDQGFSLSDTADFTVLSIWAWYGGRLYFDWMYRGKCRDDGKIAIIKQAFRDYPKLIQIGVESDLSQMNTTLNLKDGCPGLPVMAIVQGGPGRKYNQADQSKEYETKIMRIRDQWTRGLTARTIYINRLMKDFNEFEHEFKYLGKTKHDDIMDSCGGALEILAVYNSPKFIMCGTNSVETRYF